MFRDVCNFGDSISGVCGPIVRGHENKLLGVRSCVVYVSSRIIRYAGER